MLRTGITNWWELTNNKQPWKPLESQSAIFSGKEGDPSVLQNVTGP